MASVPSWNHSATPPSLSVFSLRFLDTSDETPRSYELRAYHYGLRKRKFGVQGLCDFQVKLRHRKWGHSTTSVFYLSLPIVLFNNWLRNLGFVNSGLSSSTMRFVSWILTSIKIYIRHQKIRPPTLHCLKCMFLNSWSTFDLSKTLPWESQKAGPTCWWCRPSQVRTTEPLSSNLRVGILLTVELDKASTTFHSPAVSPLNLPINAWGLLGWRKPTFIRLTNVLASTSSPPPPLQASPYKLSFIPCAFATLPWLFFDAFIFRTNSDFSLCSTLFALLVISCDKCNTTLTVT